MIALVLVLVWLLIVGGALACMGITNGPFERPRSCPRFGECELNCPAGGCVRDLTDHGSPMADPEHPAA